MTRRRHRPGRKQPAPRHRHTLPPPPFVTEVAEMLVEASPLPLLEFASGLIEATTPTSQERYRPGPQQFDSSELMRSFVGSGYPELVALARAGAVLMYDEELLTRLRQRPQSDNNEPPWLSSMGEIQVEGAQAHRHVLGDGESILISWRWSTGGAATAIVYIDHNMGTLVKDAFVVDQDLATIQAAYEEHREPGMTQVDIALADARAKIVEALELFDQTIGMDETETWPLARPLIRWLVEHLPPGGDGFTTAEWSESDRNALMHDFRSSTEGELRGLTADQVHDLLDPLLWFACDYGPGDPLRWSPVRVEIVLADWFPRKVIGLPPELLKRVPDVLAGFVTYAHRRARIPADLTAATIAAIEYWRPDFDEATTGHGADDAAFHLDEYDMEGITRQLEAALIELVGGADRLAALDDKPLDDEPFPSAAFPDQHRDLTTATLDHLDRWATDLFDAEVRTIARAVLAAVLVTDKATFKRTTDTAGLAAAVLGFVLRWIIDQLAADSRQGLPWTVDSFAALSRATGVAPSTISSRARTVANVVDRSDLEWWPILHSVQRRQIIGTLQHLNDWREHKLES